MSNLKAVILSGLEVGDMQFPWQEEKAVKRDFPGDAVVENLPADAEDTGLIPGPGRSHMPRSNYWACALEPASHNYWSPCTLKPMLRNKRSHHNEKPMHWNKEKPMHCNEE